MTVQRLHSDFVVQVYETHARIALQAFDIDQFNQCQTALKTLYSQGLTGNEVEFLSYWIIYSCLAHH